MSESELILYPVTGWEIGTVPAYDSVFIRLNFLSHAMQSVEQSHPGRRYVFQAAQLRELRDAIDRALRNLESSAAPGAPPDTPLS